VKTALKKAGFKACQNIEVARPIRLMLFARVLQAITANNNAEALFPLGGPAYQPFFQWAIDSKRCFESPVKFLVHAALGVLVSFRGALRLNGRHPLWPAMPNPCLSACPAGA